MYTVYINPAVTLCLSTLVSTVSIIAPLLHSHRHILFSEGQAGEKFEHLKQKLLSVIIR